MSDLERAKYFKDLAKKYPQFTALEIEMISIRLSESGYKKVKLEDILVRCEEYKLPFRGVCDFIESFGSISPVSTVKTERKYLKWADTDLDTLPKDPPLKGNLGNLLKR